MKKSRKLWHVLAFVAVFAAFIAIVMLLRNALIPSIIGWSAINYWQAGGLIILCKILFGGFGHHWHRRGKGGFGHHHKGHERLREKLHGMSRDERREFIRRRMTGDGDFNGWDESSADEQTN